MDAFAALADPVRRSLLSELRAAPCRVVDLAASRPISRPAVSRHLRLLLEAGLVAFEDRGRERFYALAPAGLTPVAAYVAGLARVPNLLDALETEVRRTTRERRSRPAEEETA